MVSGVGAEREPEVAGVEGEAGGMSVRAIVGIAVLLVVLLGIYTVTFAPSHIASWQSRQLDGTETVELGDGVSVVPPEHWREQPYAAVTASMGDTVFAYDPALIFGRDSGRELRTPDGGLSVEVRRTVSEAEVDEVMREAAGSRPRVIVEQLASGLEVRHVVAGDEAVAVIDAPSGAVLLHGRSFDLPTYLPAFSQLLEAVSVEGVGGDDAEEASE